MKLKFSLLAATLTFLGAASALAGPQFQVYIGTGGGCAPRPVYCPPPRVNYCAPVYYGYQPVVYYNRPAAFYNNTGFSNQRVVSYDRPVYRVPAPVYGVPVQRPCGTSFGWR